MNIAEFYSAGHEAADIALYDSWNVDYVKSDSCSATQSHYGALQQYGLMAAAIKAAKNKMLFSLCGWLKW